MRTVRIVTAAILATSGLVAVGLTTETASAAGSKNLTVSYSAKVIKNETFFASGTLTTAAARPVKLQYRSKKSSGSWSTALSTTSNGSGNFSFATSTTATRYYRYYAPASGGFSKIEGTVKKVTVVPQTITAYVTPNPVYFYSPSTSVNETVYAVITISPARTRNIKFTTPNGENVSVYADSKGRVVAPFTLNKGAGTYSIVPRVQERSGAAAKSATAASVKVQQGFFIIL